MGRPNGYDLTGCGLAVLGLPFDCGTHPVRIGARGPVTMAGVFEHTRSHGYVWTAPVWQRQPLVRRIGNDRNQPPHSPQTNRRHDAELGQMRANGVH